MKRTDLSAGSFSYIDAGTTNDPPIVLLHAMGRSAADWDPIIKHLQDDFRVLAFDMRGHGNSCRPGKYSAVDEFLAG